MRIFIKEKPPHKRRGMMKEQAPKIELMQFISDVTLFLQSHKSQTDSRFSAMFQRAYRLYVKYDVEQQLLR